MIETIKDRPFFYDVAQYFTIEEGQPELHGRTLTCRDRDDLLHELYHVILGHRYICGRGVNDASDNVIAQLRAGRMPPPVEENLTTNRDVPLQMGEADRDLEDHLEQVARQHLERSRQEDRLLALSCLDRPARRTESHDLSEFTEEIRASFLRVSPERRRRRVRHLTQNGCSFFAATIAHVCEMADVGGTYFGSSPLQPIEGAHFYAGVLLNDTVRKCRGQVEELIRCTVESSHIHAYRAANCTIDDDSKVIKEVGFNL